jgi:HK97 family phage prohead protease
MDTLRDIDLVRDVTLVTEWRAAAEPADDVLGVMDVRFSVFDTWYEVDSFFEGTFMEKTARGSFTKTISENRDTIKVLYDHGHDFQVGNKVLGPITDLREKKDSPVGVVDLLDTTYNRDLLPGLKRGVYGSSFRFRVIKDEWNDEPGTSATNPKGLPERTIKEIRLFEFGPVTFPANPAATAGVRSATDHFYEALRASNPDRFAELVARATSLRTPGQGAAPDRTDEPHDSTPRTTQPERRQRAANVRGVTA